LLTLSLTKELIKSLSKQFGECKKFAYL